MSTQPTPTPSPTPAAPEPVIELIRSQRVNVGYALTVLAALFLVAAVMMVVKSNRLAATTTTATEKGKDGEDPFKSLPTDAAEKPQPNRFDYLIGAFGAAAGLVICGAAAAFLIVSLPRPTESEQLREARVLVLTVGGHLGAALILLGVWFFYRWSDSLVKWLDQGDFKEAKYVLYPVLMIVLGGGLMMLAIQPARAEERNNTTIRRLVYGSNFGLTILILFVVLVIANAVVAMRLPNKLDTTLTGFYTLNDQTKQLLETLDQPIRAYAIFQDGADPVADDTKRLLKSAQDANPSKFQVRFLSPALNRDEISKLRAEYPLAEMSGEGVLLVAGEEGAGARNRHTFLRGDEFGEQKEGPGGRPTAVFNGEPKLLRELMFLAENKNKPKVYFTQSSGELALAPGGRGRAEARRGATGLKAYLEKNYFDVQPLVFDEAAPAKVPDDAAVVLVADPIRPIPPNGVEAIRKFMTEPRPDGKKGKLVVLVGAQSGVDGKVLQTGLESILQPFGVGLSERFLYAGPSPALERFDGTQGIRTLQVGIALNAVRARNPVAMGFNKLDRVEMVDCRELLSNPAGGAFSSTTVLLSLPDRLTWQTQKRLPPDEAAKELAARLNAVRKAPSREEAIKMQQALTKELDISDEPRELAVFVSEGQTARVAVFGCGWFVSDEAGAQATGRFGARGATLWLDLMGSTLDWVRDRPTVSGIQEKQYTEYTLKPGYDNPRLIYVPLGIGLLIVFGLGAGVWVVRRK